MTDSRTENDKRIDQLVRDAQRLRYSRRTILRRGSALGLGATAMAGVLGRTVGAAPVNRAPAFLQGTKLSVLVSSYFVPAGQELHQQQLEAWGAENNVEVSIDFSNWPDLQPKIGAAVESGAGPDVIELRDTWPNLYSNQMADLSDLAEKVSTEQGGFYDWAVATAGVEGKLLSIPHGDSTIAMAYRPSYFAEAGVADKESFPKTWEEFFAVAKQLKAAGKPVGQALGQSLGDPPGFAYPFMWSYGAMEVEDDGTTIALNKPEFKDALEMFITAWKDGYDETGLSWDDSANNRAFLSDQISATLNGSSVYLTAKKNAEGIDPGTDYEVQVTPDDIDHVGMPSGPAGRFNLLGSRSYAAMNYGNVEGARAFLEWWYAPEQFQPWLEAQQGYHIPAAPKYAELPIYTTDPKLTAYSEVVTYGRNKGYAGPANRQAAEVISRNIIVNTYAEAIQNNDAQGAIDRAVQQMERIYGR